MKRFNLFLFPCLVVVILAFSPLFTGSATVAGATTTNCGSWKVVPGPRTMPQGNELFGLAAIFSTDVWVVGAHLNAQRHYNTLAEHWNGSFWSIVPGPNVGNSSDRLYGVAAVSSTDVWAVGFARKNSLYDSLIEHWNGSIWSVVGSPGHGTLVSVAVISAKDVWAVGYTIDGAITQLLVEHWNGSAWSIVKSPDVKGVNNFFSGITAIASNDVWAVGNTGTSNTSATLTEHWNGTSWSIVSSPNPKLLQGAFIGVTAISSNDVWAVGNAFVSGASQGQTLTEHWNGTSWTIVKSPNPISLNNDLAGVTAFSTNDVWAVGTGIGSSLQIIIEHWNGSQWTIVKSPNPSNEDSLSGVTTVAHTRDMWATGTYFDSKGILHSLTEFHC